MEGFGGFGEFRGFRRFRGGTFRGRQAPYLPNSRENGLYVIHFPDYLEPSKHESNITGFGTPGGFGGIEGFGGFGGFRGIWGLGGLAEWLVGLVAGVALAAG